MILYQIWTGLKPWGALTNDGIEQKVLAKQRPEIPKQVKFQDLITNCWDVNPSIRKHFSEIIQTLLSNK